MLKYLTYRKFRVYQTYKDSKPETIYSDSPLHAAECYAELNCLGRDTQCYFIDQYNNNTKRFNNQEIGTILVTEKF